MTYPAEEHTDGVSLAVRRWDTSARTDGKNLAHLKRRSVNVKSKKKTSADYYHLHSAPGGQIIAALVSTSTTSTGLYFPVKAIAWRYIHMLNNGAKEDYIISSF